MARSSIRALVFDVFGTVVDWRSTVIAEGRALAARQLAAAAASDSSAWCSIVCSAQHMVAHNGLSLCQSGGKANTQE